MSDKLSNLLEQLAAHIPDEQLYIIEDLKQEIAKQLDTKKESASPQVTAPILDKKTGCYRREGNSAYYCPSCYENTKQLSNTQRINSKLRICLTCRETIK